MRQNFSEYLDKIITYIILLVTAFTPLLVVNFTTEYYDFPKISFLVIATVLLLGLWILSWVAKGKITYTRTPLDVPLLITMATILASTYFSTSRYTAVFGNFPNIHSSAYAWITYILLYFVIVSNLKSLPKLKNFLYVLYGSAVVVAVISLLSFIGINLPFSFSQGVNFTTTGSTFSTLAFLLIMLPLPLISLLNPNKFLPVWAAMSLSVLFSVTIIIIGSIPTYVLLGFDYLVSILLPKSRHTPKTLTFFAIPAVVSLLTLFLALLPFSGNVIQHIEAGFPKEIQLPMDISWKISASAFRDAPFIGTGPGSYLFNFTAYKPVEFNSLLFWNYSFDTAFNEFFQVIATLGLFGIIGLVYFCYVILSNSFKNISLKNYSQENYEQLILSSLSLSGFVIVLIFFIHASTVTSTFISFLVGAALMLMQPQIREKESELAIGIHASTSSDQKINIIPSFVFILYLAGSLLLSFQIYNVIAADVYHRLALNQVNKSGNLTYQYLQKTERLNPYIDLYRVDLSQINFALANALAAGNSAASNNKPVTLSDKDKQTIQTLLSQSINEGKAAVALSPRSSRDWEVLASIYRNITGVAQNALTFSLDAYGRAIQRDPLNPVLRVNVGGIYYTAKNYAMAVRFFNDAVSIKADYANAYYNLALALRDQGDLKNAQLAAQKTVGLLQSDTTNPNYKTASALLADLTVKLDAQTKNTASAGQTSASNINSALANPNLPKLNVADMNNPPEVSTPAAVTKKLLPTPTPLVLQTTPAP